MRTGLTIMAAALVLAGCSKPATLTVEDGWVRLAAAPGRPGVAYFTLRGGASAATLINVTTDVSIRSEMHESMAHGGGAQAGMATMRPIESVPVPADATIEFAPGGRHVMLFDVNPIVKPGSTVTLTLTFSDGRRIIRRVNAVAAGAPAPA